MSSNAEKDRKKSLSRSFYIRILVFFGLIGLSAAAMRPVQSALLAGMSHIRTNIINKIETETGMEVRYSSIRPAILGSFDIKNLRLIKNDADFLSISRARVSFSMLELLFRKKTAVHSVLIEKPVLHLDLEKDRDTLELLFPKHGDGEKKRWQIRDFFPAQAQLKIRDCHFSLSGEGVTYQIDNMNIDIASSGGVIGFDGKFDAEYRSEGLFNKIFIAKTHVGINGVYPNEPEEGRAKIVFSAVTGTEQEGKKQITFFRPLSSAAGSVTKTLFETAPFGLDAVFKERVFILSAGADENGNEAFFNYNTETGEMHAGINCRDFALSNIVKFSNNLAGFNQALSVPARGNAAFHMEDGAMKYSVNLSGRDSAEPRNSFVFRASGSEKSAVVEEARFYSSSASAPALAKLFQGSFDFSGKVGFSPFAPSGVINFNQFSLGAQDVFTASFKIAAKGKEIQITGENIAAGRCVLDNAGIYFLPQERYLSVSFSAFSENGGSIFIDSTLNYSPRQFEASLSLDSFSVMDIAHITRPFSTAPGIQSFWLNFMRDSVVDANVFFATDFNQIVYNTSRVVIVSDDFTGNLSFSGTDRHFTLSESVFSGENGDLLVSAQVNFANPNEFVFLFNANYRDLSWHLQGSILDRTTLIIRDPGGLHVYGSVSNSGAVSGYIEGMDFTVPVNGQPVYLNFYAGLRYISQDFWSVEVNHFKARAIDSSGGDFFNVSGIVDQDGASFRDLVFLDNIGYLAGGVNFSWDHDFSYLEFIVNMTDGHETGEYYNASGMLKNNHFNASASVSNMRLDRFLKRSEKTLVNGDISLSWDSLHSFDARLNLKSLYSGAHGNWLQVSADVLFTNDELSVTDLKLDYARIQAVMPELKVSRSEGFAKMNAEVNGLVFGKPLESKIELDADFGHMDSWVEMRQALSMIEGSLSAKSVKYANAVQEPFAFDFARYNGALSVVGGPRNMLRLEMDRDGNFFTSLSSPFPVRSSVVGKYTNGNIDAHCSDFFMDLSALWDMLPSMPGFAVSSGYITAKLDIRGPLLNPEFFGQARGSSIRIRVPDYISQDIRPVPFNAVLEGSEMTFGPVSMTAGSGGGTVSGWLRFEKWAPRNVGLDILIPRETPVPYDFNITGFLASGDASGKLFLVLENSIMEIKGDLYANSSEIGLSIDKMMQARTEQDSYGAPMSTVVNLTVTTGSAVEFVWPNTNMPILRANPEMGTVMTIFADTMARQYSLNSDIVIRSGELNYFDRSFYIRSGNLVFRESEQQFNPRLSARAEIRDRTDSGPVTISMIIENEPLLSFAPRFEANPVLTQLEIYSLLGQNMYVFTGSEGEDSAQRFILNSSTDLLAQFFAGSDLFTQVVPVRQFERQIRNFLNLDMFSVRTRLLQNAVINAYDMGQRTGPVDRTNRVGNYFDNTTVFIGKYVGQNMFIQGMLSMRYDENNPDLGGLTFEPDIGIELQSPLFNIRWDFFPYHPENWWMNDNSITLTWSKTF